MECTIWDVQHGSAATITTPNNKHIQIDLGAGSYGSNNATFSPLLHLKGKYNVSRLDAVILTHPHRDHLDDIFNFDALSPAVLCRPNHLPEDAIRSGNQSKDKSVIDKYLEISNRFNSPIAFEDSASYWNPDNVGGVKISTFIPTKAPTSNLNNHSVVTVVSYAHSKMLIPGDNEPASWKELLEKPDFIQAIKDTDIFVAPHHGRESGYCSELFDVIAPKLVIVSDGPFCDTSATGRYSQKASGWKVHKRSGGSVERYCLTTRQDGLVHVKFGIDSSDNRPFISVTMS